MTRAAIKQYIDYMLAASLLSGDIPSHIRFHMPFYMLSRLRLSFELHLAGGGVATSDPKGC